MKTLKHKIRYYDIAYACFTFCGIVALIFGISGLISMDSGTAGGIGILILVPLAIASLGAMIIGLVYTFILFNHWPLIAQSLFTLLFFAEIITEFGPIIFYSSVPIFYGIITSIFGFIWFGIVRKNHI